MVLLSFSSKAIVISAGMCSALFFSKAVVVSAGVSFLRVLFLFKGNNYYCRCLLLLFPFKGYSLCRCVLVLLSFSSKAIVTNAGVFCFCSFSLY